MVVVVVVVMEVVAVVVTVVVVVAVVVVMLRGGSVREGDRKRGKRAERGDGSVEKQACQKAAEGGRAGRRRVVVGSRLQQQRESLPGDPRYK